MRIVACYVGKIQGISRFEAGDSLRSPPKTILSVLAGEAYVTTLARLGAIKNSSNQPHPDPTRPKNFLMRFEAFSGSDTFLWSASGSHGRQEGRMPLAEAALSRADRVRGLDGREPYTPLEIHSPTGRQAGEGHAPRAGGRLTGLGEGAPSLRLKK
jgi:hypothetical protein